MREENDTEDRNSRSRFLAFAKRPDGELVSTGWDVLGGTARHRNVALLDGHERVRQGPNAILIVCFEFQMLSALSRKVEYARGSVSMAYPRVCLTSSFICGFCHWLLEHQRRPNSFVFVTVYNHTAEREKLFSGYYSRGCSPKRPFRGEFY